MLKLWLSAFGLESSALGALALGLPDSLALASFIALHAGAALCVTAASSLLFPAELRQPRRWLWSLLFGLAFFVPVIGLLCILAGVYAGWLFPSIGPLTQFPHVASPEYSSERELRVSPLRGGSAIRAHLRDRTAAPERRLQALIRLSESAPQSAAPLLHEILADPLEDMRLLAYGMLDRREKEISERLALARQSLATAQAAGDRATQVHSTRAIAHLYWELVYQNLAQGDMANFALDEARAYADRSLDGSATDGAVWLLIARIELRRMQLDLADQALTHALATGLAQRNAIPYLAELRFRQGRLQEISRLMYELGAQPTTGPLASLQEYWAA
ncbi:MAG: hypothetical protein RR101_04030 [Burkholderiaceae bacterium]